MVQLYLFLPRVVPIKLNELTVTYVCLWYVESLKPSLFCFVRQRSITQVVDLLEGLRCSQLPLLCEHIIEVPIRNWLVAAALQKDGSFCVRKAWKPDDEQTDGDEASDETDTGGSHQIPQHCCSWLLKVNDFTPFFLFRYDTGEDDTQPASLWERPLRGQTPSWTKGPHRSENTWLLCLSSQLTASQLVVVVLIFSSPPFSAFLVKLRKVVR